MKSKTIESSEKALKHLFGADLLKQLANGLRRCDANFNSKAFVALAPRLKPLEMKARVHFIRDALQKQLPQDYPMALALLLKSAQAAEWNGMVLWPITEFVQTYGLQHPAISLDALKYFTTMFTAEWAVRPFIKQHPRETMRFLLRCAEDENVHVRRWASEGTRPRVPWGERLQAFIDDPALTRPILEQLKWDTELYVRTSVANHLNDISKNHPAYVIALLQQWQKEVSDTHRDKLQWIVRHALRSLIKSGHPEALALLGVGHGAAVEMAHFKIKRKHLKIGDQLDFVCELVSTSDASQKLVVDYVIHFVKANSGMAAKVFKLKTLVLPARGTLRLEKSHSMRKITTRVYYAGAHLLEIQVNGKKYGGLAWKLSV